MEYWLIGQIRGAKTLDYTEGVRMIRRYLKSTVVCLLLVLLCLVKVPTAYGRHQAVLSEFYETLSYNPEANRLTFKIPQTIPQGNRFFLHISARLFMGDKDSGRSAHYFDDESIKGTWIRGKTYTCRINSQAVDTINVLFSLVDGSGKGSEYDVIIKANGAKTAMVKAIKEKRGHR